MMKTNARKRAAILKAADVAMSVLRHFERERPKDKRPRAAIAAARAWGRGRIELGMKEVRQLSLDAHAAARACKTDVARYAARAAGQTIAVAHTIGHAPGAKLYADKLKVALVEARKSKRKKKYP